MLSVRHFRDLLENETIFINDQCKTWQSSLDDGLQTIPEEACGQIQVAIGQAQLLKRKKFEQFRGLVDLSEKSQGKEVTVNDLQGFWELMNIQVEDIRKKFADLEKLKKSNWEVVTEPERQPLAALNNRDSIKEVRPCRKSTQTMKVKKDFAAEARERLAQAKAAMKRLQEGSGSENATV